MKKPIPEDFELTEQDVEFEIAREKKIASFVDYRLGLGIAILCTVIILSYFFNNLINDENISASALSIGFNLFFYWLANISFLHSAYCETYLQLVHTDESDPKAFSS